MLEVRSVGSAGFGVLDENSIRTFYPAVSSLVNIILAAGSGGTMSFFLWQTSNDQKPEFSIRSD